MSFFSLEAVVVGVFLAGDAVDDGVEFDGLGGIEGVVRLVGFLSFFVEGAGFFDSGEGVDPEGAEISDTLFGSDAKGMFPEGGVGGDVEDSFDAFVIYELEVGDGDAGTIEDDFFRVVETVAMDGGFDLGAKLSPSRKDGVGDGVEGEESGEAGKEES